MITTRPSGFWLELTVCISHPGDGLEHPQRNEIRERPRDVDAEKRQPAQDEHAHDDAWNRTFFRSNKHLREPTSHLLDLGGANRESSTRCTKRM